MPIYEYSCAKCKGQFEVLVRKSTDTPAKCPKCGAAGPTKLFSSFAVAASAGNSAMSPACDECPGSGSAGCASGRCPMSAGF